MSHRAQKKEASPSGRPGLLRLGVRLFAGSALCLSSLASCAQKSGDLSAFLGRWKIDLSQTHMNRGNNITRSESFTFIFEPSETGLTMQVYAKYPQPAPTRTSVIIPDQQIRVCMSAGGCLTVGGNPSEQSYAYYQIDARLLLRVFYLKGEANEYSTYAVSADGKTFTMIAWGSEAPDRQNIQVFNRQDDSTPQMQGLYRPHSVEPFMKEVDTDHDGLASEAEWKAAGLKMDSFLSIQWFNDTISTTRLEHHPFPPQTLDDNGDLTVSGMKAYETLLHGFNEVSVHPKNVDKMVAELDRNHDGKIVLDEWKAGGLNPIVFVSLDKRSQGKGYLVPQDILTASFTDYMMDADGNLTVESMKAYDARRHPGHPDNQQ